MALLTYLKKSRFTLTFIFGI